MLLTIMAFVVTLLLYLLVGARALYFALAPTLLIYGFMNWDLVAVALATAGTFAYLRRRDVWSGVFLGLGAAAKLYPALLLVPFVAGRFREREPDRGIYLAWASIGTWLTVNAPFAIASPQGWWEFFRFNSARSADWDSLWFLGCHRLTGNLYCLHTRAINVASVLIFGGSDLRGVALETPARAGLPAVDPRVPDPHRLLAVEQGVLAAVRAMAAPLVRAHAAEPAAVPGVLGLGRRRVPDAVLLVRAIRRLRRAPDRRVRARRGGTGASCSSCVSSPGSVAATPSPGADPPLEPFPAEVAA